MNQTVDGTNIVIHSHHADDNVYRAENEYNSEHRGERSLLCNGLEPMAIKYSQLNVRPA